MKIKRFIGGNIESNGYVIYQQDNPDCYIIDPGYNPEVFLNFVKEKGLKVIGILLTHHHYDHVGGVARISSDTGAKVYLHRGDLGMYKGKVDVVLENDSVIMLGDEEIRVINTPGHTMGSVCFYCGKSRVIFTGDTVFDTDIGRTDLKDGSPWDMLATMQNIVDKWENDMVLYPGHGKSCNMKFIRKNNSEFIGAMAMEMKK
ncbi:MAG: MBL fold metallo-hydrolase [Clostridia bacterium]|nr:MBL fold metallo-hydrolase [Clostridia bacterium]